MSSVSALPTSQTRSQRTRDRILDAAEGLLRHGGPAAATVPAIADAAGVAVGSVYRRFADKDSVLRGVYQRFLARSIDRNREALSGPPLDQLSVAELVACIVGAMVRGYQQEAPLLAALTEYAEQHPDRAFRRDAMALREHTFAAIERLLLARRKEIHHPHPDEAIRFFLTTSALVLKGVLLQGKRLGTPLSAEHVTRELERMALGYFGIRA